MDETQHDKSGPVQAEPPTPPPPTRWRRNLTIAGSILGAAAFATAFMARGRDHENSDEPTALAFEPGTDTAPTTTCRDGWPSNSTGSGTCSSHGGIAP